MFMRRCVSIITIVVVSLGLLSLFAQRPSAASGSGLPEIPLSLDDGDCLISFPSNEYLVTGCTDSDSTTALTLQNRSYGNAVYHLTLCGGEGEEYRYFPSVSVDGGRCTRLTVILSVIGNVSVGQLRLSGYQTAEIRIASSGGCLRIQSLCSTATASETAFLLDDGTASSPAVPDAYRHIGASVTLDTPLTLSLSVKENDICTITFIISGFPDRQIVRKIVKGDCIADIPTPENDPLRVFLGWSLLPEADRFPDLSLPIETDMTLYARFHYHDFSEYDHDAEGHWKVCRCSDDAVGEKTAHEFRRTESPEYLVSPADCTHAAVYRYSCFCGAVSDMTFESSTEVAKGHTEETKGNKIICSECGAYLRDLPPEENKGTPSGDEETPPHGNTENNSADNSSRTENETPAPKSLPPIAAVSIIAGLLLAAILTIWIAIRRNR